MDPEEIFRMFFGFGNQGFGHGARRQPRRRHDPDEERDPRANHPQNKLLTLILQLFPIILIVLGSSGFFFNSVGTFEA